MFVPVRAQVIQMGLKFQYSTKTVEDMYSDIQYEYNNFSTEFLKKCDAGLLLRINIGRWITIQPEANFSISSVWDSVDAQGDFLSAMTYAFQNINQVRMDIPVLASLHLVNLKKVLHLRLFAGPEFSTTIKGASNNNIDFSKYSIVAGVGVDLIDVIYVDARIFRPFDGELAYRLGVGLLF